MTYLKNVMEDQRLCEAFHSVDLCSVLNNKSSGLYNVCDQMKTERKKFNWNDMFSKPQFLRIHPADCFSFCKISLKG